MTVSLQVLGSVSKTCKTPSGILYIIGVYVNLLKDKEVAGTNMSHTKSNAHSAGDHGQEKNQQKNE